MENIFIINHIKPNHPESEFYIYDSEPKIVRNIDAYIGSNKQIITFDIYNLNEYQRKQGCPLIENVIDIEGMAQQIIGKPKNEFAADPPWTIWQLMKEYYKSDKSKKLEKIRQTYYGILENDPSTAANFHELNVNLKQLFENLKKQLFEKNENERFFEIELKITKILLKTNYHGICLDNDKVNSKINEIINQLYQVRNELQLKYKIFSGDDKKHIVKNLKLIDFEYIANAFDTDHKDKNENYHRLLKDFRHHNRLIELLYLEKKYYKNSTSLLRIGNLYDKMLFPIFESFGSVTGRILVEYPLIQQLSREHRSIIVPAPAKELVYIDYSQFEAGILANECDDDLLIECYENDIYSSLSQQVFQDKEHRELCKQIFFKYSYGAKMENMECLLRDFKFKNLNDAELKEKIQFFFDKFNKLETYRNLIINELKQHRKIGSKKGNYRYANPDQDELMVHEENWAMNQRIQGTASYILKRAIIKTYETDPEIDFLIPMHDAVLYQVPAKSKDDKIILLKKIYESVFKEICPQIKNPVCKIKAFTE